jgi:lipid A ethanolaminephosphotransferase
MWFGDAISKDINLEKNKQNQDKKYSQDNLFHTLLSIFEVKTEVYDGTMDILHE